MLLGLSRTSVRNPLQANCDHGGQIDCAHQNSPGVEHQPLNFRHDVNSHFHGVQQAVDWTVPKPGGGVNDYIEILVKETVTLHKVLSRYLSTSVVEVSVESIPDRSTSLMCSVRIAGCDDASLCGD